MTWKLPTFLIVALFMLATHAQAQTTWTNWTTATNGTPGSAAGTVGGVNVSYSGELIGSVTNGSSTI